MSSTTVFISHVHEEGQLAQALSKKLTAVFAGGEPQVDFFESSKISPGALWAKPLDDVLSKCKVAIVLVSGRSIDQPWIHFEIGRAWSSEVLPICHSGFDPARLGSPLGVRNALDMSRPGWMRMLVEHLAKVTGWKGAGFGMNEDGMRLAEQEINAVVRSLPEHWPRPRGSTPAFVFEKGDALECLDAIEAELRRCKSVSLAGIGLHIFRRDSVQALLEDRVRAGDLSGRICMANWNSAAVQHRIRREFLGRMPPNPAPILDRMIKLERDISNSSHFAVRQFEDPPPHAIMIFDQTVYAYPYAVALPGDQGPTFCLTGENAILRFYADQFNRIWEASHTPFQ
jgi:TIR domain